MSTALHIETHFFLYYFIIIVHISKNVFKFPYMVGLRLIKLQKYFVSVHRLVINCNIC